MTTNTKLIFTWLLLILSLNSFSQELLVKNFKEITTDISAREHEVMDINDEPCALIKIYTGLGDLKIDGNRGVEQVKVKSGVVWVWVPDGTRQLKVSKSGMPMLPYFFPKGLKGSTVYSFDLTTDQLATISINTPGVSAQVELDGKVYNTNEPIADLAEKEFSIRIFKLGYFEVLDTISVSNKNNYFKYSLERAEQAKMSINTIPTGCVLFMDNNHVGMTNHSGFYYPGAYRVKISKKDYETIDTVINFDPKITGTFAFNLSKNTGFLQVKVLQIEADLYVDGEKYNSHFVELNAGVSHELEIKKVKFRTYSEPFRLERNDTVIKEIKLVPASGDLSFIISPESANINMTHEEGKEYNWTGNQNIKLPTGTYDLNITNKGYFEIDTTLIVNDQKKTFFSASLLSKDIKPGLAGLYSTLLPGMGQFYAQRKLAGALFMTGTLGMAGATGFFFYQSGVLATDYDNARQEYLIETDFDLIEIKRQAMDEAYDQHASMAKQRDVFLYITAGIWTANIIDAVVFAKYHKNKDKKLGLGFTGNGVLMTYKF